jgi:hypothetical protein
MKHRSMVKAAGRKLDEVEKPLLTLAGARRVVSRV